MQLKNTGNLHIFKQREIKMQDLFFILQNIMRTLCGWTKIFWNSPNITRAYKINFYSHLFGFSNSPNIIPRKMKTRLTTKNLFFYHIHFHTHTYIFKHHHHLLNNHTVKCTKKYVEEKINIRPYNKLSKHNISHYEISFPLMQPTH